MLSLHPRLLSELSLPDPSPEGGRRQAASPLYEQTSAHFQAFTEADSQIENMTAHLDQVFWWKGRVRLHKIVSKDSSLQVGMILRELKLFWPKHHPRGHFCNGQMETSKWQGKKKIYLKYM